MSLPQRREAFTTVHELRFQDDLARRKPALAVRYCRLVIRRVRVWDTLVDENAVVAHALWLLGHLTGSGEVTDPITEANL